MAPAEKICVMVFAGNRACVCVCVSWVWCQREQQSKCTSKRAGKKKRGGRGEKTQVLGVICNVAALLLFISRGVWLLGGGGGGDGVRSLEGNTRQGWSRGGC